MRLVFLGTPAAAVPPLRAVLAAGHEVALVVSQPDRRRGRGPALSPSPVKEAALAAGLPVTDRVDDVLDTGAELGVVVAFGRLIKQHVLDAVPMVNLHFSLLPRWRGAAPVERAILAGDAETGVCLMSLEAGLDTGPVHRCEPVAIDPDESAAALRDRLVELGTALLVDELAGGLSPPRPQEGEATYAAKIEQDDLLLDWARPAEELERVVRVGGAWTTAGGRRLKVHRACAHRVTGDGVSVPTATGPLELLEVQPEGRPRMAAADWARGAGVASGRPLAP
ncbi:MAG TPA: methionyl-tRNA formyltransferase [Acidimicrobiales bacterium]|nr:methionyl-tRNA formyltransferase [Acidimicrobiales bacterium]